jgi:MtN3 and saliva related transmembrane protein
VTTPEILAVVATLAGFAMALSPTLQIRRMRRTRSSRDVSLLYLSMLDLGFVAWISYGWSIGNWALILSNTASLTIMTATILVALRFRRRRESVLEPASGASPAVTPLEVDDHLVEEVSDPIDR